MNVINFFIAGLWFAGLIFLFLLLFIEIFFRGSSEIMVYALGPAISSFIIGGKFGLKILGVNQLTHKELAILGIKIPIYSALFTLFVAVFLFQLATIFDLIMTKNDLLGLLAVLIIFPLPLIIGGIMVVILPISPFICLSGILGTFLLNYLYKKFIDFINRNE